MAAHALSTPQQTARPIDPALAEVIMALAKANAARDYAAKYGTPQPKV